MAGTQHAISTFTRFHLKKGGTQQAGTQLEINDIQIALRYFTIMIACGSNQITTIKFAALAYYRQVPNNSYYLLHFIAGTDEDEIAESQPKSTLNLSHSNIKILLNCERGQLATRYFFEFKSHLTVKKDDEDFYRTTHPLTPFSTFMIPPRPNFCVEFLKSYR